jgi:hypothetical protein
MRESSPPTAETADDNHGRWDILVNGESIQEKDDVIKAKHHSDDGCLIADRADRAAAEHQMVSAESYKITPLSFSIRSKKTSSLGLA